MQSPLSRLHRPASALGASDSLSAALAGGSAAQAKERMREYLLNRGNGSYLFGQMATWVHHENPDMRHRSNWIHRVQARGHRLPGYACVTYDFVNDPFSDDAFNAGVQQLWDRGLLVGVSSFFANPCGGAWNAHCDVAQLLAPGNNPVKAAFIRQLDRMAANLQWMKDRGIPVVYTPFVESDDHTKWHATAGQAATIRLYRFVHDYFTGEKGLDHILWAYHTTQDDHALIQHYPGDAYVDILGRSSYGSKLVFSDYEWAVMKKRDAGKVIWWAELGIRSKRERRQDCMNVLSTLHNQFPELAGFVFWGDAPFYNVAGNRHARSLMANPQIVTLAR
jgi:hypothetical protein